MIHGPYNVKIMRRVS
jgi:hypothetical protein